MNPLADDLDHILVHTRDLWDELRGQRIFITGGTGFFGCWLLESFAWANDQLKLGSEAVVLTRDPKRAAARFPRLATRAVVQFHAGDVTSFDFPAGEFTHVIHAATETDSVTEPLDRTALFEANIQGTRRVLDFAEHCRAHKLLFTSSGAVYGPQPAALSHVPEDYAGAPDPLKPESAYGQSKRVSEFLCAAQARKHGLEVSLARCFAFVGPHLPLNANYAIGNFIRDALRGGPIQVKGDGTPLRSYLYAADLAIWLWTLLCRGRSCCAYNVGSDAAITIADLARMVARIVDAGVEVLVAQQPVPGKAATRYVPSIDLARKTLGLEPWIDICKGIERTADFVRKNTR
jgi:nucleoside-diphosphate-sugar epimerase